MAAIAAPKPGLRQRPSQVPGAAALCGGIAGCTEALVCHPLDTIKVRLQTGARLAQAVAPAGLYRGLAPVVVGMAPKMAVRFASFDAYSSLLLPTPSTQLEGTRLLAAGLLAGVTEAVLVVTPSDVLKIRMQTQTRTAGTAPTLAGTLVTILRGEGPCALWRGVRLTAARQGTNQAANFFTYVHLKHAALALHQRHDPAATALPAWQTALAGFLSGSMGPLANAPLDTIKTRIQKQPSHHHPQSLSVWQLARALVASEGVAALYRGVSARVLRVGLGQSVTFCAYEMMHSHFGI